MTELVDRYGRRHTYLRISVTDRCNLRCAYCMPNEDMVWNDRSTILTYEEIIRVARIGVGLGITKVRITGGEPLVRTDVEKMFAGLKLEAGVRSVAITTNGILLERKLPAIAPHLDAINISLDTFHRDRFKALTRRDQLDQVLRGIDAALQVPNATVKLNVVVMRGVNEDEIPDFIRFAGDRDCAVRFIEFMPFAGNAWSQGRCVTMTEMLARAGEEFDLERIPDDVAPISRDYRVIERATGRRHRGTIGFIASMSHPFCDSCSRLRLTAEGRIMPCLHSPLEFDLRDVMRSGGTDEQVAGVFFAALAMKPEAHPEADELMAQANRGMIQIGG